MVVVNIAVFVAFISLAQAGYYGQQSWGFEPIRMPRRPFAPFPPTPPFAFAPFRPFPPSAIKVPSPGEIVNIKPGPGQYFTAISAQSKSNVFRDKDGNIVKTGGSTVVTNDNGNVDIHTVGNNPPSVNNVIVPPKWQ